MAPKPSHQRVAYGMFFPIVDLAAVWGILLKRISYSAPSAGCSWRPSSGGQRSGCGLRPLDSVRIPLRLEIDR